MAVAEETPQTNSALAWSRAAAAGLVLMDLVWLAFVFSLLFNASVLSMPEGQAYHTNSFWRAALILGLMYAGAYAVTRLFAVLDVKINIRRAAFMLLLAGGIWAGMSLLIVTPPGMERSSQLARLYAHFVTWEGIPPEFWVLAAILMAWRRSVSVASQPVDQRGVSISFQFGLLTLMISELFHPRINAAVGFHPLYVFVFLGLFAMGAARIAETNGLRGAKMARFDRLWLVAVAGGAAVVVGIGALVMALLNGWVGEQVGTLLLIVMSVIGGLTVVILFPLLRYLVDLFLQLKDKLQLPENSPLMQLGSSVSKWMGEQGDTAMKTIERYGKPVGMIALLVLLLFATLQALRWYRRLVNSAAEKGRSTLTAGELLKEMADAARKRAQEALDELARLLRLRRAAGMLRAARIRWVYRQMMALCADLGNPRPEAVTPLEFVTTLETLFPTAPRQLREITAAYLRVRYGELPESDDEVSGVMRAWEEVNHLGQQSLASRRKR
jgi:hypothetical protein